MNAGSEMELRIHSGVHAGASALLDLHSQVLGADPGCDFVLGDAGILPQQVRLEYGPTGWSVLEWSASSEVPGKAQALQPGVLHKAGPLVISINDPQAPWPPTQDIDAMLVSTQADTPEQAEARTEPAWDKAAEAMPQELAQETTEEIRRDLATTAVLQAPRNNTWSTRSTRITIAALLAVIAGTLVWVLLPGHGDGDVAQRSKLASATRAVSSGAPVGRAAIDAVILAQGLAQRVKVETDPQGRLLVRAALLSDDEYEKLALALSALAPRPALAVTTEQDLQLAVSEALTRNTAELESPITARHMGGGQFRLEGTLRSAEERSALLAILKGDLPALVVLESGLLVPQDLAQRMLDELRQADFANLVGQWTDGRLDMIIRLAQADVPRWEQLLANVARKHKVLFSVKVLFSNNATVVRKSATEALPFHLQSVVSGGTPYVVLDGGVKLLLDGRSQGWRLVSVEAASVVFESAGAKRVVVQR